MKTLAFFAAAVMVSSVAILGQVPPKDTVSFEPAKPTSTDNITFELFNLTDCCVTVYHKQAVQVGDTTIYLTYEYDDSMCAYTRCLIPGAWATFASKPIPAGKYSVYKVASIYCPPPRICPGLPIRPIHVGTLVVSKSTAILAQGSSPVPTNHVQIMAQGTDLRVILDRSEYITLQAFRLDGSLLATIFRGFRDQGSSRFSLKSIQSDFAKDAIIIKLSTSRGAKSALVFLPKE